MPGYPSANPEGRGGDKGVLGMKNVISIGSGLGGLFAGNLLARKGHKVTIFESYCMPGGYTAGFTRRGYYFESGTINFEASASVFLAMKDIGVLDQIDFERMNVRFFSEHFDGIPANYTQYKKMIYSGFPSEKEKLDAAFADLDAIVAAMGNLDAPMPFLHSGLKAMKSLLPFILRGPKLMKLGKQYGDLITSEFAARYFEKGSPLHRLFMGYSYPDIPAISLAGALLSLFEDFWTVKGGMQSWADVLAENFRKLGGELKLKSHVDRIITKNGAAAGVSSNNIVYDADVVIAAGDYKKTFLELLDDRNLIPQGLRDSIGKAAVSEGYFTVYLGLDMPNEELAGYMKVAHVISCDKKPGYDIYNPNDAEFFSKTSATLFSPSMINPKHAPQGKSSLMLMTMAPYHWMDNWGGGDRQVYRQLKEKAMEAMIEHASRMIPGLREHIQYEDAATPLTYARFTHNTDGATSAWSFNPQKKFHRSIFSVNVKTPVKNLYIGSCWAMQYGGIPGALAAAYHCADRIK